MRGHRQRIDGIGRRGHDGERPTIIAGASDDEQTDAIRAAIDDFRQSDHNTLGVICKTADQARALFDALDDPHPHLLDAASASYSGGVMIATAFLAKGSRCTG